MYPNHLGDIMFIWLAIVSAKIPMYFEKAEMYDHTAAICYYRQLETDGLSIRIIKEGTIFSCPKIIYYDPETPSWSETP